MKRLSVGNLQRASQGACAERHRNIISERSHDGSDGGLGRTPASRRPSEHHELEAGHKTNKTQAQTELDGFATGKMLDSIDEEDRADNHRGDARKDKPELASN